MRRVARLTHRRMLSSRSLSYMTTSLKGSRVLAVDPFPLAQHTGMLTRSPSSITAHRKSVCLPDDLLPLSQHTGMLTRRSPSSSTAPTAPTTCSVSTGCIQRNRSLAASLRVAWLVSRSNCLAATLTAKPAITAANTAMRPPDTATARPSLANLAKHGNAAIRHWHYTTLFDKPCYHISTI